MGSPAERRRASAEFGKIPQFSPYRMDMEPRTPGREQGDPSAPRQRNAPRPDPTPQYVYWIRRAVAILILLALVAILVFAIKGIAGIFTKDEPDTQNSAEGTAGSGKTKDPAPTKSAKDDSAVSTTKDGKTDEPKDADKAADKGGDSSKDDPKDSKAGAPAACDPSAIVLALSSGSKSVVEGKGNAFNVDLTYQGQEDCLVDLNASEEVLTIFSGSDRIWSSADCETDSSRPYYMEAGAKAKNTINWNGDRSNASCAKDMPTALPGTYRAVANYKDVTSNELVFQITKD